MTKKKVPPSKPPSRGTRALEASAGPAAGPIPIVGVGASAGGLEAFSELLTHLPLDTGMGFVFVQHLDPQHESALTSLLQRRTTLPVTEVTNNLRVEANHVYVIPPNTHLGIVRGVLTLEPRAGARAPARSVDLFLEALAADQHERAIGVVLSGTASDGMIGLEAIKGEGGITFAQDETARFDSMPRSAIAAGCVDYVLPPEQIALELARIARHPAISAGRIATQGEDDRAAATAHEDDRTALPSGGHGTPASGSTLVRREASRSQGGNASADDAFKKILILLRNHCGVDFSLYKSSTIQRRVTRRMVLSRHDTLAQYTRFLRGNSKELDTLYSDVLISVTSFFRNPDSFDVLQQKVWPAILQRAGDQPVRVWVLGCSTGQEAYSIAMSFVEAADAHPRMRKLQVFATDLNEALLDKARHGLYAKSLVDDVSPERLQRFFVEEDAGYRVTKVLREMVVFARQNLIGDPPFSRMDLVSCRNLLIYFEPDLQRKAFPVFHYALKPHGFLYLGASESVGGFTDLFEPIDKKHKIYTKKSAPAATLQLPVRKSQRGADKRRAGSLADGAQVDAAGRGVPPSFHGESNAQREADRVSINRFAPPSVLISSDLQVIQFRGPTGAFLQAPSGRASFDVLKMARAGLILPLRAAIAKARKDHKPVRKEHVSVQQDGTTRTIDLEVIPLVNLQEPCFLVVFVEVPGAGRAVKAARTPRLPRAAATRRIAELESTLTELRDYQQSQQEQHEATTEELQSSNEEIQSANEELQSLNEELETSKEELESANEELTTFNEEVADRNAELGRLNTELSAANQSVLTAQHHTEQILRTLRDPVVILSGGLKVISANEAFYRLFRVAAEDVEGHKIYDVGNGQWNVPRLRELLEEVLARNSFFNDFEVSHEFESIGHRTMLLNARRLTDGDEGDMILLGIHDITETLQFQVASRRHQARYKALVDAAAQVIWTTDAAGAVVEDSPSWRAFTGQAYEEWRGWGWLDAIHPDDRQRVHEFWLRTVQSRTAALVEYRMRHVSGGWRWTEVRAVPVFDSDGSVREWVGTNLDITERRAMNDRLREADQNKNVFLAMLAHELRNPLAPMRYSIEIVRRLAPPVDPEAARAIEMIERQVGHMARLVDDLLDVSRISRGRITLRVERVDLTSLIRLAVDAILPLMDAKQQAVSVTLPPEAVFAHVDATRITQIVGNLLHNAWKFTGNGGRIDVSLEIEPSEAHAVIHVRDTGIGIASEHLPRVFEMFQQVDTSLERTTGGLGIGLTLVRTLAEMHGGTAEANSAGLGEGSDIAVRLPIQRGTPAPAPVAEVTEPEKRSLRILVVDDNSGAAEALATVLRMRGHVTQMAFDGHEAIDQVTAFDPDVVLLDIGLPGMDGYEVARRVRARQGHETRPVLIALTGWGHADDRRRSEDAGFNAHAVKPVDPEELVRLMFEALKD